jgi:hypothetical protein
MGNALESSTHAFATTTRRDKEKRYATARLCKTPGQATRSSTVSRVARGRVPPPTPGLTRIFVEMRARFRIGESSFISGLSLVSPANYRGSAIKRFWNPRDSGLCSPRLTAEDGADLLRGQAPRWSGCGWSRCVAHPDGRGQVPPG